MEKTPVWRNEFPIATFSAIAVVTSIFGAVYLGIIFLSCWRTTSLAQIQFCGVILLGLVANAFICGALSGPHERYQARLTWLVPLAGLIVFHERRNSNQVSLPLRVVQGTAPSS